MSGDVIEATFTDPVSNTDAPIKIPRWCLYERERFKITHDNDTCPFKGHPMIVVGTDTMTIDMCYHNGKRNECSRDKCPIASGDLVREKIERINITGWFDDDEGD